MRVSTTDLDHDTSLRHETTNRTSGAKAEAERSGGEGRSAEQAGGEAGGLVSEAQGLFYVPKVAADPGHEWDRSRFAATASGLSPDIRFGDAELVSSAAAFVTGADRWGSNLGEGEKSRLLSDLSAKAERVAIFWGRKTDSGFRQAVLTELWSKSRAHTVEPEGLRFSLTVGPGSVQISASDPVRKARAREKVVEQRQKDSALLAAHLAELEALADRLAIFGGHGFDPGWRANKMAELWRQAGATGPGQRAVEGWSAKSRARMVRTLAQLDYSPLFEFEGWRLPAMVTLTYPRCWLRVAPNGASVKRHFDLLRKRFARAWGEKFRSIWKLEFQGRRPNSRCYCSDCLSGPVPYRTRDDGRAPHVHLWMLPPVGSARGEIGGDFRHWLSATWAAIVDHPDPDQRALHMKAGTRVDFPEGLRARDPKRLAWYFSKAGGAAGGKEYQHLVPEMWTAQGQGPGRFWGYIGIEKATATVELETEDFLRARRILRRWSQRVSFYPETGGYPSKVEIRTVRRKVMRVEESTGRIRYRQARRRAKYLGQGGLRGGFVLTNDGAAFTSQLARALDIWRDCT